MFTGIIKDLGEIKKISTIGSNRTFYIESELASSIES